HQLTQADLAFFRASACQTTRHCVVAFMARVLEDGTCGFDYRNFGRPRSSECFRILDGELIEKSVGIHTMKAFGYTHVLACTAEGGFICEIRRLDNQCVSFPAAARIALQLSNVL